MSLRLLLVSLVACCGAVFSLECRIYNVGQANFVALRHGDRALVVDCGIRGGPSRERSLGSIHHFIGDDCRVSLIITHQHFDHFDCLNRLIVRGVTFDRVLIGGTVDDKPSVELSGVPNATFCKVFKGASIVRSDGSVVEGVSLGDNYVEDWLGAGVRVRLLLPDVSAGNSHHEQNLVLKVIRGSRAFLFPGDASSALMSAVMAADPNALNDVDSILLPHHGSDHSGELGWFWLAKQQQPEATLLTIVSSDPRGRDGLPWSVVQMLKCDVSGVSYCALHSVSVGGVGEPRTVSSGVVQEPLFVTCDADALYYRIIVDVRGIIRLYCGDEKVPQFCSSYGFIGRLFEKAQAVLAELENVLSEAGAESYREWLLRSLTLEGISQEEKGMLRQGVSDELSLFLSANGRALSPRGADAVGGGEDAP